MGIEGREAPPIYQQLRGLREPQSVLESTNGSILERAEDLAADFRGGVTYVGPKSLWIGVFHGYLMPAGYLIPVSAADPWKVPSRWILRVVDRAICKPDLLRVKQTFQWVTSCDPPSL